MRPGRVTLKHGFVSSLYDPPVVSPLRVHFVDADLLVVEKPAGLLSVPGRGPDKADCLATRVQAAFPGALIVHRLDMETSGLMVMALSADVHRALSGLFERREVSKTYEARVFGEMSGAEGDIDLPLIADWPNRPLQKVDYETGKPSATHWRVCAHEDGLTRVELTPRTGRSHQLRVHLDAIGHPILGDSLYGTPQSRAGAGRLELHATGLGFVHPVTGASLKLHSAAPF